MSPFASKMTPEPVPVPWADSATIVTTAGLTALAMSTIEPLALPFVVPFRRRSPGPGWRRPG